MTEKINTPSQESEAKGKLKITGRGVAVLSGAALVAGGAGGYALHEAVDRVGEALAKETVYEEVVPIPNGGSLINEVENRITLYLEAEGEDADAVMPMGEIVYQSQDAAAKWQEEHEQPVQPGALFDVSLYKSDLGGYSVDIEPHESDQ